LKGVSSGKSKKKWQRRWFRIEEYTVSEGGRRMGRAENGGGGEWGGRRMGREK
jgi:hypothetical protein